MAKKYFKLVSAVHLFLIKDNQILLSKRKNTGYEDGKYSVIAGHLNGNETVRKAAIREAKEEAGINVNVKDLVLAHVMHRKGNDFERIDWFFTVKRWKGTPTVMEKEKCSELSWYPLNKLPQNIIPYVKSAINNSIKKIIYSEFDWEYKLSKK